MSWYKKLLQPPEIFILLTIVALLGLSAMMVVGWTEVNKRDSQRKADLQSLETALSLFKNDYGFYPNYSMYLGLNKKDKAPERNFDLGAQISLCQNSEKFATKTDLNSAKLKEGFDSVSEFLICLNYLTAALNDPLWAGTFSDYQYRVSYDFSQILLVAKLENARDAAILELDEGKKYYLGGGVAEPALTIGYKADHGMYIYQCVEDADGKEIKAKERANAEYAPYVRDDNGKVVANPLCGGYSLARAW